MKIKSLVIKNYMMVGLILVVIFSVLFLFFVRAGGGGGYLVQLTNPLNNSIDLDGNVTFSYIVGNTTSEISNCSLIFDGNVNQTDSNITKLVTQNFYLNGLSNGDYIWGVDCVHSDGNVSGSENRTLEIFIDTISPTVTLNGPANGLTDTDGNLIFNYTVTDNKWVTSCDLYTDINGTWQVNQTNIFVQKNTSLYFEVENIPDATTFKWNVVCYDFAVTSNSDWGNTNWTLSINNSAPTFSTIPNQNWQEDNSTTLNLSNYFSDPDGHNLTYNSTLPNNITVSINNKNDIATLKSDTNWFGSRSITFYAFDIKGKNVSSNSITLTVDEAGDTPPNDIYISPVDDYNDTDGFVTFTCNATDDYSLVNISLYTNTTGIWHENQTAEVSGMTNSTSFTLSNLTEGSYKWACKFEDNSSQSSWSENRTFNVDITVELDHEISNFTINHVDHNRTVVVSYSSHINNSLTLGNLTIYLSNGSIYFNKDMSNSRIFVLNSTDPPLNLHAEKIRIKYNEIFYGNFTVGNEEWLNITLKYYYLGDERQIATKHTIEVKAALPT